MFNWREIARKKQIVCLGGSWYGELIYENLRYYGYARKANTKKEVYGDEGGFKNPEMAGHDLMVKLALYEKTKV